MKRWIAFGTVLFSSLLAAATPVKLALNWKPEAEFGGFYAADTGAYEKHGLKVEILPGGVGTPVVQMVAAGRAEFGISTADEVVISRARGTDVVALFTVYQTNPQGLMTQAARGAKSISELLNSGTLAIQKGMPYYLWLEKKFGSITARVVPYQGGIGQMVSDKQLAQQCYVTSEPLAAKKQGVETRTFLIADSGYDPYSTVLITRQAFLKKNKATVDAMLAAVREGWTDYLKDPAAVNAVMAKLNPTMDVATLKESAEVQKPLIETEETKKIGLGGMTKARWAAVSQQLKDLKVVEKIEPAETYFYSGK